MSKLVIRIKEKGDGWLAQGGTRVDCMQDATKFDSIYKAVAASQRSGITEDNANVHWELE